MNVITALDARTTSSSLKKSTVGVNKELPKAKPTKKGLSPKPQISEEKIREKIANKNDQPHKASIATNANRVSSSIDDNPDEIQRRSEEAKRTLAIKKQAAEDLKAKSAEIAPEVQEGEEASAQRGSDVGKNNPTDPATVGKLKDVLSKGAFKFSDKERDALSKILN